MIETLKKVIKKVSPGTNLEEVTREAHLVDDLGFDSISMVMLGMELEEELGFHFEANRRFETVGEVLDYIDSKRKKK